MCNPSVPLLPPPFPTPPLSDLPVTGQATANGMLATRNFFVVKRAARALDPVDSPDPDPVDPPVTPGSADPDAVDPDPVDPDATTATITPPPTDNADAISATVVVKPPVKAGSRRRG